MVDVLAASKAARGDVELLISEYATEGACKPDGEIHSRWSDKDIIDPSTFTNQLKNIVFNRETPDEKIIEQWNSLADIFRIYRNEVMLCSEPIAFRNAFKRYNHKDDDVDINELVNMRRSGLNFIPVDPSIATTTKNRNNYFKLTGEPLRIAKKNMKEFASDYQHKSIDTREQGMVLTNNFVRTCKAMGDYSDRVTDEFVTYDPTANASALIRARYLEKLSERLFNEHETGLVIQLMKKLKIRNKDIEGEEYRVLYVMTFCEVIPFNRWPKNLQDELLDSYKRKINLPYLLRPMDPSDVKNHLLSLIRLNDRLGDKDFQLMQRTTLETSLANEWSYPLKKKCREAIRSYISSENIKCSHSTNKTRTQCETRLVDTDSEHIGHIFSQYWCEAYVVFQESMNHPDNLYLSCPNCNIKLKEGCPDRHMLRSINKDGLTIGDLLRKGLLQD